MTRCRRGWARPVGAERPLRTGDKRIHTAGSLYSYATAGLGVRIGGYLHDTLRSGPGQQPGGLHPGCAPRPGKFGGFTLMVVYLLLSLGAVRGLRGHPRPASVWVASTIGAVLTGGAIFGSLYRVPAPTVWAPVSSLIVFAVVLAVTAARRRSAAD